MNIERTPRFYPLPHQERLLSEDVLTLREAITRIDEDMTAQEVAARQGQRHLAELLRRQRLRLFHQFGF